MWWKIITLLLASTIVAQADGSHTDGSHSHDEVLIKMDWAQPDTNTLASVTDESGATIVRGIASHVIAYGVATNEMTNAVTVQSQCQAYDCIPANDTILTLPASETYYFKVFTVVKVSESNIRSGFVAVTNMVESVESDLPVEVVAYKGKDGKEVSAAFGTETLNYNLMLPTTEIMTWNRGDYSNLRVSLPVVDVFFDIIE